MRLLRRISPTRYLATYVLAFFGTLLAIGLVLLVLLGPAWVKALALILLAWDFVA